MKILILGATGMLGNTVLGFLKQHEELEVYATVRNHRVTNSNLEKFKNCIFTGINVENNDVLTKLFAQLRPDIVINCIGLIKQLPQAEDYLQAIPVNSLLPHRIAALCEAVGGRLIHISTDCVFSGKKGNYTENDIPDAKDLYGLSKLLGEVHHPHITLRTSIIGHESNNQNSLVNWFLAQQGSVKGFTRAIFSGLTTVELARVIYNFVLHRKDVNDLYHVSVEPIAKFDLLKIVKSVYKKDIEIIPSDELIIDRSLNSERFQKVTGYRPPSWQELIERMYSFNNL
ncbi:MAG: SDR family oxidoreductase [Rickettsiaceae bacterium]|nr:MAG: SDR family oxidoreductase [Rickettsiaceae bacterium]